MSWYQGGTWNNLTKQHLPSVMAAVCNGVAMRYDAIGLDAHANRPQYLQPNGTTEVDFLTESDWIDEAISTPVIVQNYTRAYNAAFGEINSYYHNGSTLSDGGESRGVFSTTPTGLILPANYALSSYITPWNKLKDWLNERRYQVYGHDATAGPNTSIFNTGFDFDPLTQQMDETLRLDWLNACWNGSIGTTYAWMTNIFTSPSSDVGGRLYAYSYASENNDDGWGRAYSQKCAEFTISLEGDTYGSLIDTGLSYWAIYPDMIIADCHANEVDFDPREDYSEYYSGGGFRLDPTLSIEVTCDFTTTPTNGYLIGDGAFLFDLASLLTDSLP